jgi:tripartite-type tricarboxylate transporter receptor subunit TctC
MRRFPMLLSYFKHRSFAASLMGVLLTAQLIFSSVCNAQATDKVADWPTKPVTLVVPFAPGGPTDTIARLLAEQLRIIWRQPVVVDYKAGAGTMVGTQYVARSQADGYTLGMAITAHMINPSLQAKMPYDTTKDLTGLSLIGQAHFGLFAHPSLPASNMPELIDYAKKNPGTLSYATPGNGTGTHLAGEMLKAMAGIDMTHIPYKGSAPAQQDVIGGRVPLLFDVLFSAMPYVKDNRLKAIGLASPKRAAANPEIGLIADKLPGFSAMSLIGVIAPSGLSKPMVQRISADIAKAVNSAELTQRMNQLGIEPVGSTSDDYNALIQNEINKWSRVVKAAGIKIE